MKELNITNLNDVTGGFVQVLAGVALGYVGGKVIDAAVSIVKEEIKASRAASTASREGKTRVKTSRGYRYR
jgi:hypothetical protein